jgi:hypothetical protein
MDAYCSHCLRFVDRDKFMRFLGGGIGHKATKYIQQSQLNHCGAEDQFDAQEPEEIEDTNADKATTELHARLGQHDSNDEADVDVDVVDADEEADFGYGNSNSVGDNEGGDDEGDDDGEDDDDAL